MKKLTLSEKADLHERYSAVNDFIYKAYSEGVIDGKVGESLYKYLRKLLRKDDPLYDKICDKREKIPLAQETIKACYKVRLWDGRSILGKFYLCLCYKIGWIQNRPSPTQNERRLYRYCTKDEEVKE